MLNGHGDDLHLYDTPIKYNFSSNIYYKGCNKSLLKVLSETINIVENYPSPIALELNNLAAHKFNINENQFLFTNGATEAFYLIAQRYIKKKAIIVAPTFSEYEDACKINKLEYHFINREQLDKDSINSDLVFICNPNNPDGKVISAGTIEKVIQRHSQTHFIIDEAYIEFTNKAKTLLPLTQKYNNITIVRSLTKTFVIPGLRLGYVVSNANFIKELLAFKMPWSVNSIAIEAGKYIFENYENLSFNANSLIEETEAFKKQLSTVTWLKIVEGTTSYFLVELKEGKAAKLKEYLINNHQILIRDATNFKELKGEYIRLSVQSQEANNSLINALSKWN